MEQSHVQPSTAPRPLVAIAAVVLVLLSCLLLAAHFLRDGQRGLALCWALLPALLLTRQRWVVLTLRPLLVLGAGLWLETLLTLVRLRQATGQGWTRLALILGVVLALTLCAAWLVSRLRGWCVRNAQSAATSAGTFLLTAALLAVVQLRVPRPMLLLERLWPGGGWLELALLASYAGWLASKLHDPATAPRWRRRAWQLLSLVFFGQLALGLLGLELCLMRPDRLHFPIPALIVAGPLYRGEGLFMLILLVSTLLLVGPAWCSHICYLGSWDQAAADRQRRPRALPGWARWARWIAPALVLAVAATLRAFGVGPLWAGGLALGFGLGGIAVMLLVSRRQGTMAHCTVWCPVGLLANLLGRLSPFRLRIASGCDGCMRCRLGCRFGALEPHHIQRRRPGLSCTLCGDCIYRCPQSQLHLSFPALDPAQARALFLVLVVALHAATLGLARV